jgi:RND family efflux transporter MFP subunit
MHRERTYLMPLDTKLNSKSVAATDPSPYRRRRCGPRLAVLAIAATAFAGAIYGGILSRVDAEESLARRTAEAAVPGVTIIHPAAGAPQTEIALPGYTQAYTDTPIYARTSGYLKAWHFDIGAHVRKGDLLAEIDTPEVDQQLNQAKADLVNATANAKLAAVTAWRFATLAKDQWASQQTADDRTFAAAATNATVDADTANVKRLEQLQSYEKVDAPFDGIITARNTDIGALINADANSPSKELFRLAAIDTLRVYVAVPESYARAAQPGAMASLNLDEFPGRSFQGTLVRNANAIDLASRTLLVEVDVANPNGLLPPGAYTFVHLRLPGADGTVTVPSDTLLFRREGLQVAVVRDGRAQLVPVTIGRDYGEKVEILAGLHTTDNVIVNPSDSLINGTAVEVEDAKQG